MYIDMYINITVCRKKTQRSATCPQLRCISHAFSMTLSRNLSYEIGQTVTKTALIHRFDRFYSPVKRAVSIQYGRQTSVICKRLTLRVPHALCRLATSHIGS